MIYKEIAIYEKKGDKFIHSIELRVEKEKLREIFILQPDDPDYLRIYKIGEMEYSKLKYIYPELEKYSLEKFDMFIESFETKSR